MDVILMFAFFSLFSADADDAEWEKTPKAPAMAVEYMLGVPAPVHVAICGSAATACAWRVPEDAACYIVSYQRTLSKKLDVHERKHCAGYDHPVYWHAAASPRG